MRGRETERDIQKERETHVLVHSPGTQSSEIRAKSRGEGRLLVQEGHRGAAGSRQGAGVRMQWPAPKVHLGTQRWATQT